MDFRLEIKLSKIFNELKSQALKMKQKIDLNQIFDKIFFDFHPEIVRINIFTDIFKDLSE